jgi:hypothetical protein
MHLINIITGVTTVQNYRGSLIICYIRFRAITSPAFSLISFPAPTCYWTMRRDRRLTPSTTNNTHNYSLVNRLLNIVCYTCRSVSQYSQNRHDKLKQKTFRSSPYLLHTWRSIIRCYGNPKLRAFGALISSLHIYSKPSLIRINFEGCYPV